MFRKWRQRKSGTGGGDTPAEPGPPGADTEPRAQIDWSPPTPREQWTIPGVFFISGGWKLSDASPTTMRWAGDIGGSLTLTTTPVDNQTPAATLDALRRQERARARASGADILQVEAVTLANGCRALEVLTKKQHGLGYAFEGRLMARGAKAEYEVLIGAAEATTGRRTTGVRQSIVSTIMMTLGEIDPVALSAAAQATGQKSVPIPGFCGDPYDSAFDAGALHSVCDDARLDAMFFDALSLIRHTLRQIAESWSSDDAGAAHEAVVGATPAPPRARVLLSDNAVREILWTAGLNDVLELELVRQLGEAQVATTAATVGGADVVQLFTMLGLVQHNAGRLTDAAATLQHAVALSVSPQRDTRQTGVTLFFLGRTQKDLKQTTEAVASFRRALAILDKVPGASLHLRSVLALLGELLAREGRIEEAAPLIERAQGIPATQPQTGLQSLRDLAGLLPARDIA